ncbi:MAG: undecaprenyldiphospho-muramoylpentapeptide beta-N-acetylglucosaminyltransferase [Ignavibacteria bacterium GWB2_35_6b]|nr:MAG: undecaprenyldiphospho-muramoylpentapeptide beta-N-acetylglucosaminyltransferase [Ignavibacteria bacterium GWB2_35_6b]
MYRFIFAGGGTGGHLYPAIAVAEQIRLLKPESEILFVGTKGKIEARVVPKLGFDFKTIWISGLARKLTLKNILFPVKVLVAMYQSLLINIKLKPKVAIGTGAYVSGPVLWGASIMGSKIILLEQNSFPGVTNRMLEKRANEIHISFEDSKKYFRTERKLILSGNPVRTDIKLIDRTTALKNFDLNPEKKTLLILGGSLGAKNINEAVKNNIDLLLEKGIQIIWQTGGLYFEQYKAYDNGRIKVLPFIDDMASAYSACDLLAARAGATTIAEVAQLGLPVVFIPSKNVAANHQYKNAKSLVDGNAAELIEDENLSNKLFTTVYELINNENRLLELKSNIKKFSKPDAAKVIAERAIKLAEEI